MTSNPFRINVEFRAADLQLWRSRFDLVARDSFPRALQFVLNEIAKTAVLTFRRDVGTVIDRPKEWTSNGLRYRRVNLQSVRQGARPYSETYVLPKQSAVLKYLMGSGPNVRRPGDVGPSQAYISLPIWRNLDQHAGIRADAHGNLPSSTLRRIRRHANVTPTQITPNPRGTPSTVRSSEFFFGQPTWAGGRQGTLGFYSRPKRVVRGGRLVADGVPHLVIAAIDQQVHKPVLQAFWMSNAQRAAGRLVPLLRAELRRKIAWARTRRATT
jgi:hypothetical protein